VGRNEVKIAASRWTLHTCGGKCNDGMR
jgi:hypothetical protein